MASSSRAFLIAFALGSIATFAQAAPPDANRVRAAVNELRAKGCFERPAVSSRLKPVPGLDEVAEDMATGKALRHAVEGKSYRMTRSASVRMARPRTEAALKRQLREEFCAEATDPGFRDIGVAARDQLVWIVLAIPFEPPSVADTEAVNARMLQLVNQARSVARHCGAQAMPPAPPVKLDARLAQAALNHSRDLARRGEISHAGADGSTPAVRATRAGYTWRNVAENVAGGQTTPEEALQSWIVSPGHCATLMSPLYLDMGIAFFVDRTSPEGIYWTQMFGALK